MKWKRRYEGEEGGGKSVSLYEGRMVEGDYEMTVDERRN